VRLASRFFQTRFLNATPSVGLVHRFHRQIEGPALPTYAIYFTDGSKIWDGSRDGSALCETEIRLDPAGISNQTPVHPAMAQTV